jgi:hypothetical protein
MWSAVLVKDARKCQDIFLNNFLNFFGRIKTNRRKPTYAKAPARQAKITKRSPPVSHEVL